MMPNERTREQTELRRHAEWADASYKTIATIAAVAADLQAHAKIVRDAGQDQHGRRVSELRRLRDRLAQVYGELGNMPQRLV